MMFSPVVCGGNRTGIDHLKSDVLCNAGIGDISVGDRHCAAPVVSVPSPEYRPSACGRGLEQIYFSQVRLLIENRRRYLGGTRYHPGGLACSEKTGARRTEASYVKLLLEYGDRKLKRLHSVIAAKLSPALIEAPIRSAEGEVSRTTEQKRCTVSANHQIGRLETEAERASELDKFVHAASSYRCSSITSMTASSAMSQSAARESMTASELSNSLPSL